MKALTSTFRRVVENVFKRVVVSLIVAIFCFIADRLLSFTGCQASLAGSLRRPRAVGTRMVEPYRLPSTYPFIPQRCWLCNNPTTVLQTLSCLLDDAIVHHGHWYSSYGDTFRLIPSADLESKHAQVNDRHTGATVVTQPTFVMLVRPGTGPRGGCG